MVHGRRCHCGAQPAGRLAAGPSGWWSQTQYVVELKQHILMIDDDRELCDLLGSWLEAEGFRLTAVHVGAEGLEAALYGDYGAIVLDMMLPGMNGLEVLRALRQSCNTPLLMLSARGEPVDRILGLELGARSEEHTSELQSRENLVCRLLL